MNYIKRLLLVLIASGLSTPALADTSLLVPNQRGGLKVDIDVLYLRPTNSDLHYATKINPAFIQTSPDDVVQNGWVGPSYQWGLYAQLGYLFPCTANDLTLGYTYLPNHESIDSITADPAASFISVLPFNIIYPITVFSFAEGKAGFNLNVVDLEGGQRFTIDTYDMRMFAGLRYANLDQTLQTLMNTVEFGGAITGNQEFESQFRGLGPRIGVDARYCLSGGFGIDANVSSALLVGQVDASYMANLFAEENLGIISHFQAKNDAVNRLVPVLEAKLGIDYTYIMDSCCRSSLMFEFGYQLTNYFNAIDHARVVDPAGTSFAYQNTTTDLGVDGFYLGVKYYA